MNLTLRLLSVTIAFVAATFAGVTACAQNIAPTRPASDSVIRHNPVASHTRRSDPFT